MIDAEMKFTAANTPSVFSSVIDFLLDSMLSFNLDPRFDGVSCTVYTFHGVAALFIINKRSGSTKLSAITIN